MARLVVPPSSYKYVIAICGYRASILMAVIAASFFAGTACTTIATPPFYGTDSTRTDYVVKTYRGLVAIPCHRVDSSYECGPYGYLENDNVWWKRAYPIRYPKDISSLMQPINWFIPLFGKRALQFMAHNPVEGEDMKSRFNETLRFFDQASPEHILALEDERYCDLVQRLEPLYYGKDGTFRGHFFSIRAVEIKYIEYHEHLLSHRNLGALRGSYSTYDQVGTSWGVVDYRYLDVKLDLPDTLVLRP